MLDMGIYSVQNNQNLDSSTGLGPISNNQNELFTHRLGVNRPITYGYSQNVRLNTRLRSGLLLKVMEYDYHSMIM